MFDAKNLLEMLMKGASGQAQPTQASLNAAQGGGLGGLGDLLNKALAQGGAGSGGLGDILGKVLGQGAPSAAAQAPAQAPPQASPAGGTLSEAFGKALGQGRPASAAPPSAPASAGAQPSDADDDQDAGGGLADVFKKLQAQMGGAAAGAGGLKDILGQILGQATAGVSEGARRIDDATGASGRMKEATGQSPEDILNQIKAWVAQNQGTAAAGAGGLGAVVLGTHAGRSLAGKAIKLGSLALIGGLAYKALQNYQAGKPLLSPADAAHLAEAPSGSGYETAALTHDSAQLYIRAMIAAAAADGRIDANEQSKLIASMKQAGMGDGAEAFLMNELQNPASPEELAAGVKTEQEAVQVFTAARVAVDVGNDGNHEFLAALAQALGMDDQLVQQIDAAARGAA